MDIYLSKQKTTADPNVESDTDDPNNFGKFCCYTFSKRNNYLMHLRKVHSMGNRLSSLKLIPASHQTTKILTITAIHASINFHQEIIS